jgi:hypothetical protein
MMEKNRGPLALRKNILDEYKKHFGEKKEDLGNIAISLPHEVSHKLILRTRERAEEVVQILRKNRIYMKNSVKFLYFFYSAIKRNFFLKKKS